VIFYIIRIISWNFITYKLFVACGVSATAELLVVIYRIAFPKAIRRPTWKYEMRSFVCSKPKTLINYENLETVQRKYDEKLNVIGNDAMTVTYIRLLSLIYAACIKLSLCHSRWQMIPPYHTAFIIWVIYVCRNIWTMVARYSENRTFSHPTGQPVFLFYTPLTMTCNFVNASGVHGKP